VCFSTSHLHSHFLNFQKSPTVNPPTALIIGRIRCWTFDLFLLLYKAKVLMGLPVFVFVLLLLLLLSQSSEARDDSHPRHTSAATDGRFTAPDTTGFGLDDEHHDVSLYYSRAFLAPTPDMPNITLVAHATIDRLHAVARWCRTLRGPLSISVFVRPFVDDVAAVMGAFAADECIARHADLHLVTERGHRYEPREDGGKDMMTHYPFNVQRNAALDGCVGDLALLMDIDFHLMPEPNNREVDLRDHFANQRRKVAAWPFLADEPWLADAAVYVVPAIETVSHDIELPKSIEELRAAVRRQEACPFYGHAAKRCHLPTNLKAFLKAADEPYLVDYEEGYEPYVIINRTARMCTIDRCTTDAGEHRRSAACRATTRGAGSRWVNTPRYNDSFIGRGFSKMSFFFELAEQERPFIVLSKYFLAHKGRGNVFRAEVFTEARNKESLATEHGVMSYYVRQEQNKRLWVDFMSRTQKLYHPRRSGCAEAAVAATVGDDDEGVYEREQRYKDRLNSNNNELHPATVLQATEASTPSPPLRSQCRTFPTHFRDAKKPNYDQLCARHPNSTTRTVIDDPLLWRGTSGLRWLDFASQMPAIGGVSCISKYHHVEDELTSDELQRLVAGVTWACKRIHCGELMATWEAPRDASLSSRPLRYYPVNTVLEADWVFDRWLHVAQADHTRRQQTDATQREAFDARQACNFNGHAVLVQQSSSLPDDKVEVPTTTTGSKWSGLDTFSDDPVPQGDDETPAMLGCTLNPDYHPTKRQLRDLLEEICDGVVVVPAASAFHSAGGGGPNGLQKTSGVVPLDVPDAVRGQCKHIFDLLDPLLQDQLWFRASVALNAHHLIYYAAGRGGPTCRDRFGPIAVYVNVPRRLIAAHVSRIPLPFPQ
jgi:hypothetical protein